MMMPDEISLQFHNLELVIVHLRNDFRLPLLLEQLEFLTEVDGSIAHCITLQAKRTRVLRAPHRHPSASNLCRWSSVDLGKDGVEPAKAAETRSKRYLGHR